MTGRDSNDRPFLQPSLRVVSNEDAQLRLSEEKLAAANSSGALTYSVFRPMLMEHAEKLFSRKEAANAASAAKKSNAVAQSKFVSAIMRAFDLFSDVNELHGWLVVGSELTGSNYDQALGRLALNSGATPDVVKSAKAKLNKTIRPFAIEMSEIWTTPDSSFANRLNAAMKARGIGYTKLARALKACGVSMHEGSIQNWQNGKRRPSGNNARSRVTAIETCLNLPAGYLADALPVQALRSVAAPSELGLAGSVARRYAAHLEGVSVAKQDEALDWIKRNIFTAPSVERECQVFCV